MTSAVLSPADHEHFLAHGWVVVKHVAAPEAIAAAVAALEQGKHAGTVGAADYKPVKSETLSACYGSRAAAALSELFGEPYPIAPTFAGTDMPRAFEPTTTWKVTGGHVDDDYPTLMPAGWSLGCFLFLTPVKPRGGAFIYYDGSVNRYRAAALDRLTCLKEVSSNPVVAGPPSEFLAEPGDLLIFHHLQGHSGSPNAADPVTRHALLSRHHANGRVIPGDKPFDRMSTVEKANSPRYLHERLSVAMTLPAVTSDARTDAALASGWAPQGSVGAACAIHYRGRARILAVSAGDPTIVSQWETDDWVQWRSVVDGTGRFSLLNSDIGAINAMRIYAERGGVRLFLSGSSSASAVLRSDDMLTWHPDGRPSGRAPAGHYTTDYGSKVARGFVLFELAPDGLTVTARCAPAWCDVYAAANPVIACRAPSGTRIVDFEHGPTYGESHFAMIADVAQADDGTRPMFVTGGDSVSFTGEWKDLASSAPFVPHDIRVFARARNYWLVTYLRSHQSAGGDERVHWGVIDWEQSPITLREMRTGAELREALQTVGLS